MRRGRPGGSRRSDTSEHFRPLEIRADNGGRTWTGSSSRSLQSTSAAAPCAPGRRSGRPSATWA